MVPWRRREEKKRAERVLRVWRKYWRNVDWLDSDGLIAQVMLRTRVRCSCPMCGNPRRWWGQRTRQELRADDEMAVQLDDVVLPRLPIRTRSIKVRLRVIGRGKPQFKIDTEEDVSMPL